MVVLPLAWNPDPSLEKVSWMVELELHCTGPPPPEQARVMVYPPGMAVRDGLEQVAFGVLFCHAWSALLAQTDTWRCTGCPTAGVTVELTCHSPA